jgi:undecaprenyl pyrophosphate phosphatase UppP
MEFIEILKVILLGIIEGITEWLPVSSTGHMILFEKLLPLKASPQFKEMFFVLIPNNRRAHAWLEPRNSGNFIFISSRD